jgi:hypothetical protein
MKLHTQHPLRLVTSVMTAAVLCLAACSDETADLLTKSDMPIEISSTYPVNGTSTRATDNGFVADDAVGIFVVDYDQDGQPGMLSLKGNRGNNVKFTYDGSRWTANYQLYWANSQTPADFYGYYPYDDTMQDVNNYAFNVRRRQDSEATSTAASGYEASDLLWAKSTKVAPTTETVNLQYKHLMAGITISLKMGSGFTATEWAALDKTVQIENIILDGSIDLATGKATVGNTTTESIIPLFYNGVWRAVVMPQTVTAGNCLASVTVDGQTYQLTKTAATTYLSGKMHNMTITVNKSTVTGNYTFTLTSDDIVAWVDDPNLHDGLVRQYTIVKLSKAGTLKDEIDKLTNDYSSIHSLKIAGPMNSTDRGFIQSSLTSLRDVNMLEVDMEDGVLGGFNHHSLLQHFIFPAKGIKYIEGGAFGNTNLRGDIIIPEGVEVIGGSAFADIGITAGHVSFPSTLKRIEEAAFAFNNFIGELRLPDGIEYIDHDYYYVFQGSDFEGSLYLPPTLTSLPNLGFPKMTGTIVIPPKITSVGGFNGIGCTQVEFHDGVTIIEGGAFGGSQLSGELVLPPNLKEIGGVAFAGTKITRVIFPDNLQLMRNGGYANEGIFTDCKYLTGTLTLPKNVARIPAGCFLRCSAITGLVIPEGVDIIEELAFSECYSLNSIICEDTEPPVIFETTFEGVPKDNFTVEVPKGAVERYRQDPYWGQFKRIAEYSSFVCRPAQANALNTTHTEQLILNADGAWKVEHQPSWVTLSKTNGTGKTEITLNFKQMSHGSGNRRDSILFVMPEAGHRTYCVVSQYDYAQEEDSYLTLQKHSKGEGIDLIFLGDGYDGEDIANGNYLNLIKQQTEYFFGLEPYKSHRDYFNVYVGFPLSQEKGVNTMNTYVNNRFGTLYGYDGQLCTSNQLLTEIDEVENYAMEHTPAQQNNLWRSLIILVPNSDAYSGVTYFSNVPIAICPPSNRPYPQDTRGVIQHEAGGHAFGRLADEAIIYQSWAPNNVKSAIEEKQHQGWYANISTTSGLHSVPWADFIFDERYGNEVDVFEGGFSYMRGIFRPETNSCMNYGIPYFNAPSRLSIMRRIFDYSRVGFSMDYFYAHDSKEWGEAETRAGRSSSGSSYAASNQHREPVTVNAKTMGDRVRNIIKQVRKKIEKR